jgi:hypothetical protein
MERRPVLRTCRRTKTGQLRYLVRDVEWGIAFLNLLVLLVPSYAPTSFVFI